MANDTTPVRLPETEPDERATTAERGVVGRTRPAAEDSRKDQNGASGKRRLRLMVLAAILVVLVVGAVLYWLHARNYESTDDAFIEGDLVQIKPRAAGTVVKLYITDNQRVRAGDLLLEIDPRDYEAALANAQAALATAIAQEGQARADLELTRVTTAATLEQAKSGVDLAEASLAQARAQVGAAEAEWVRAKADAVRYQALSRADFASRQRLEQAEADARTTEARLNAARQGVQVAEAQRGEALGKLAEAQTGPQQVAVKEAQVKAAAAQVEAARAAVDQAALNLSYTKVYAPHDGYITKRAVNQGDVVQKDQTLAALVYGQVWIAANFKETQLTYMRPGQPVDIEVDSYPGTVFKGHVDSIQRGTGARFSLLPPENATGNYVKVVQRVPVKIVVDGPDAEHVLALGMSVVPTVTVRSGREK